MLKAMSAKQLLISLFRPHREYRCAVWDSPTHWKTRGPLSRSKRWHARRPQSTGMLDTRSYWSGWVYHYLNGGGAILNYVCYLKITWPVSLSHWNLTSGHISHNFRMHPCNYISRLHRLMQIQFCFILHMVSLWNSLHPKQVARSFS